MDQRSEAAETLALRNSYRSRWRQPPGRWTSW